MHWGSPENLSDVTHPFLHFCLLNPVCLSGLCTTHGFSTSHGSNGNCSAKMTLDSVSLCH